MIGPRIATVSNLITLRNSTDFPVKHIATGEGGMALTNNPELEKFIEEAKTVSTAEADMETMEKKTAHEGILEKLQKTKTPIIVLINKIDLTNQEELEKKI